MTMNEPVIRTVHSRMRTAGTTHARLKPTSQAIREGLVEDRTISVSVPDGQTPTEVQRTVVGSYLRVWAKQRGWRVRIRTAPDGKALIVWREDLTA